ncbi:Mg2 transporter protein CorA family protein [Desulfurobacterium thermolithotrophum DSM 11699]|uniref:Mg2 transporter protein CorA family protein n=1 Tax=Desulfurobacterium thermolithotrophum (strain DSM 11699 / BSA) TaxID=868864 RepID=F0S497_DESTD|nr:magnesium transporter CorA family protein [Desulfurobacterium thermolithotrophum]ADY73669.1 Mg2 transporter protein CorA family protein [Desulfurobacterium thermolithotrophum DSM 11699]
MENLIWIVSPEGDSITTWKTDIRSVLENEELLKKSPKWIHLRGIDEQVENFLLKNFKINELSLEDCRSEGRSKVEVFEDYVFVLMIYFDGGISRQKKLCIFWGKDFIITIGSRRLFEETRKNLSLEERPFEQGVERIFWLISSIVADKFKGVTDILEEQADEIEARVFKEQNPELLEDISDLSFEILTLRRTLKQLRDTYKSLISSVSRFINPENIHYFRDLLDEISILYDRAETLHEFTQNVLSVFSSLVSFKLNDIMKTLTILITILEPLMLISSFYGMNIEELPFAHSPYGIFVISFLMIGISFFLLYYFRRKGWI